MIRFSFQPTVELDIKEYFELKNTVSKTRTEQQQLIIQSVHQDQKFIQLF